MSIQGLNWQAWTLRLVAGLNQKSDPRALESPELARLVDGQFDEIGGIQTRYPYAALGSNILGGGTITNARRLVANGSELLLFTKDSIYSWNSQISKWALRGTHLAVNVDEEDRFVTSGDQTECDRAELDSTVVYAWTEGGKVYAAALDKTTGAVVAAPTDMSGGNVTNRPRLITLSSWIVLFYNDDTDGYVHATVIDPTDITGTMIPGNDTSISDPTHNDYYDVVRVGTTDTIVMVDRLSPTTSYGIETVAVVAGAIGISGFAFKARTCDGPIAVSCAPNNTQVQVVRANAANVQGDLITISTLADVYTAQAIGTIDTGISTRVQIACAHRSVQDSAQYRCYVFWSSNSTVGGLTGQGWQSKVNWVDTGNTLGTSATFVRRMEPGSRAFDHDGRVFLWMLFSQQAGSAGMLNNASYLYRDDGFFCAKSMMNRGNALGSVTLGHLPGVANVGTGAFAYCGTIRRVVGNLLENYAGRAPCDIVFTFDSNEARRTAIAGKTLLVAAGEVLQYDGTTLTELGFHMWPYAFTLSVGAGGGVETGTYAYKLSFRWLNARGEKNRSTSINVEEVNVPAGPSRVLLTAINPIYATHKTGLNVEVWRTLKNPTDEAPFYRVTTSDVTDLTNPNRYLPNDTTADELPTFHDDFADSTADDREGHPEDGGVLEGLAPPAASIILATDTRVFLAGVAGDPHRVWYSKLRADGEVVSFHDALTIPIPAVGGDITGLAVLLETLVVFREHAVYMLSGDGFGNTGIGINYGPARTISEDIGAVNHESIATTDKGIIFKSNKGWYLLDRGWNLQYIGGPVSDYDSETPLAVHVVDSDHQVRVLYAARMLVFDTLVGQWAEWSIADGLHAAVWNGTYCYLTSTGPKVEQTTHTLTSYGIDLETAWIKFNDLQGYGAVDFFDVLGEFRAACNVRIRLARDYWRDGVDTYFQDKTHVPSSTAGMPFELRHRPSIRQVKAIKVRITLTPTTTGESLKLTGLAFLLGIQPGLSRNVAQASKQ